MADGMGEKVKRFFGFGDVDSFDDPYYRDEFDEDRGYRESDRAERAERADAAERGSRYREDIGGRDRDESAGRDYRSQRPARRADFGAAPVAPPAPAREPQVVRLALSSFQQAGELATEFKAGDIVVLNLSGMEKAEASRVLDFSVGLAKGLDGTLKKLGGLRNFALVPASVTLDQSQLDQLMEDQ